MMRRLRSSLPLTHTLITLPLKYAQKRMQPQKPPLSSADRAYAGVHDVPLLSFAQQQHAPVYSMSFGGSSSEGVEGLSSSSSSGSRSNSSYLPPSIHKRAVTDHHQQSYHGHDTSALHPLSTATHHSASISNNMTVGSPAAAVAATATATPNRPTQTQWNIEPEEFEAEGKREAAKIRADTNLEVANIRSEASEKSALIR